MRSPTPTSLLRSLLRPAVVASLLVGAVLLAASSAWAAGKFRLQNTEIQEVSGSWHVYVTVELPKPPSVAHQPMKFAFTKLAVYERALVDGKKDPVQNRVTLSDQRAAIESLDVGFSDASGKIFKTTRFDFGLSRSRGYEAGEYRVELRTSDGVQVGTPVTLVLKGDNPVVDRRSIAFNAPNGIRKVDAYDAGAGGPSNPDDPGTAPVGNGEVTPSGSATPFIPKEAYERTSEEEIKTRPKGCGCSTPGLTPASVPAWLGAALAVASVFVRRRVGRG